MKQPTNQDRSAARGRGRSGRPACGAALAALICALVALLAPASAPAAGGSPSSRAAHRNADRIAGRYIVVFRPSTASAKRETEERERSGGFRARLRFGRAVKGFAAYLSTGQVERLRRDPEVALVTADRRVHASATLAAGDMAPFGVQRIGAAGAGTVRSSSGVNVGVIDTGVDLDHPDLNAANGVNCVSPGAPADDDNGHGTHVAGTIAARNDGAGVTGVAPGTKLFAVKVLDSQGAGTWSQMICGIDWITATRTDADPANDVSVANLSLGGPGDPVRACSTTTDPLHKAICASTAAGVTYVVAAGNDGWDFDYSQVPDVPAAYPQVLTVTAAGDSDGQAGGTGTALACMGGQLDDRYASFSNFAATAAGQQHTIAAPGVCIDSTWPGGGRNTISGTSMATPHVTGTVALCLNEAGVRGPCAGLTSAQVAQRLRGDAKARTDAEPSYGFAGDPLRPAGGRYYGYLAWAGTTTVAAYRPAGYTLTAGSVYSSLGAVSRLYSNDSSRVEIAAARTGTAYAAEIRPYATIPAAQREGLKRLTVSYDGGSTSSAAALSVWLYNFRTGTWQTLDGPRTGVTADRALTWTNTTTPKDFVSAAGEIRASVRGTASSGFRTLTDLVGFRVEY